MYTVEDMYKDLRDLQDKKEFIVDDWLKETILPHIAKYGNYDETYYPPPKQITIGELASLLTARGFIVKVRTFNPIAPDISVTLPPQGAQL